MEKYLSKEEIKTIIKQAPKGANAENIVRGLVSRGYTLQGLNDQQKVEEKPSQMSRLGTALKDRVGTVTEQFKQVGDAQGAVETGAQIAQTPLRVVGQAAGAVGDVIGAGVNAATGGGLDKLGEYIASTETGKQLGASLLKLQQEQPELAGTLGDLFNIATVGVGGAAAKPVVKAGVSGIERGAKATLTNVAKIGEKTVPKLEAGIVTDFEKAVKPLLPGKSTLGTAENYKKNVLSAVREINSNKELKFTDEAGELVTGKKPGTLQEFADSIEQTKKNIYNQYNSLAKEAGEAGVKINTNDIASELDNVIKNEALQISNPEAIKYAFDLKERLKFRDLDAETAQNVIQNYNKSLEAFYRNPTYDNASKASIDALVVNQMRQRLDDAITSTTGSQYQPLKNAYASLKAVEKDVVKASLRDARKNNKGLIDYTDILTGGDLLTGLITLNPAQFARGATARGIKEFYKYLNSPNRAIKSIFKNADQLDQRLPKSQSKVSDINSPTESGNNLLQSQPAKSIPTTPSINAIPTSLQQVDNVSTELSTPKGMLQSAIDNLKDPKMRQGGYIRNPLAKKELPVQKSSSLNDITDLLSEAKKYKTAEEFVKAQGIPVFRGQTSDKFTMEGKSAGIGKSFTTDKKIAEVYGYNGNIIDGFVDNKDMLRYNELDTNTKKYIKSIIDERIDAVKIGLENENIKPFEQLVLELGEIARIKNKKAIDINSFGIPSESEIRILSEDAIKTKSQLEDIWKKAQGKLPKE